MKFGFAKTSVSREGRSCEFTVVPLINAHKAKLTKNRPSNLIEFKEESSKIYGKQLLIQEKNYFEPLRFNSFGNSKSDVISMYNHGQFLTFLA